MKIISLVGCYSTLDLQLHYNGKNGKKVIFHQAIADILTKLLQKFSLNSFVAYIYL